MAEATDWKEAIKVRIFQLFSDSPENFARIIFFLDEESKLFQGEEESPVWKTLKYAVRSPEAFKMYALKLADDTKQIEKNARFKEIFREIYEQMMNGTDDCEDDGKQLAPLKQNLISSSFPGMNMMWNVVGLEGRNQIISIILRVARTINTSQTVSVLDDALGLISKQGNLVAAALAAVYLTVTAIKSLYKWYIGEISGKRCAKDIIDSFGSVGGGVAGGLAGANIGAFAGPGGVLLGKLIVRIVYLLINSEDVICQIEIGPGFVMHRDYTINSHS